jgi:hypothetical protein
MHLYLFLINIQIMMIISVERSFSQLLTVLAVWLKEPQIVQIQQPVNFFRTILEFYYHT